MTVLMLFGVLNFWRQDKKNALPYVILIAFFPLTYYVTHASPDYRQPIEPEIIVLAVVGFLSLRRRTRSGEALSKEAQEEMNELSEPTTA